MLNTASRVSTPRPVLTRGLPSQHASARRLARPPCWHGVEACQRDIVLCMESAHVNTANRVSMVKPHVTTDREVRRLMFCCCVLGGNAQPPVRCRRVALLVLHS